MSIGNLFVDSDQGDTLTISATLANGDPLPDWLHLTVVNGVLTFSGTPGRTDAGTFEFAVVATDTGGLAATTQWWLTVEDTNTAPEIQGDINSWTIYQGHPYDFQSSVGSLFTDKDPGDKLTITASLLNGDPSPIGYISA